ncbi:zinc ribbon domain-containing protein [Methanobrevibacter curvatus]|nr:zinc ribbon domain-containing protein [Methanobrevibacter curvatus]
MVYCKYCGTNNIDGNLKCQNCGKPLSLIPNNKPPNRNEDFHNDSIKSRYVEYKENKHRPNNNRNINRSLGENYKQYQNNNDFNNRLNNNYGYKENYNYNYNNENPIPYQENQYIKTSPKENIKKKYIEWDVIIASALIMIILSAIVNRILPDFSLLVSLVVALIYILVSTKNKSSLFVSIPLTMVVITAITAYFSLM